MTDTTDIKALRSEAANIIGMLTIENQGDILDMTADFFDDVFRLLEAERQRVVELEEHSKKLYEGFHQERQQAESLSKSEWKMAGELSAAQAEIAALKDDQVPVAWLNQHGPFGGVVTMSPTMANSWEMRGDDVTPLFTAPQKPVVVTRPPMDDIYHNKLSMWVDGFNYASKGYDANIEAAGGIVKDGE